MDVRTVNNLPAATHDETVRCLLAIELSKKSWVVGVNTPLSAKISHYTLSDCDAQGLLKLIERIVTRVNRELGRPVEVISCYEAGYDESGFTVSSRLTAFATMRSIQRASRLTEEHEEQRRIELIPNDCFDLLWLILEENRRCGVWCRYRAWPKRMTAGCTVSATVASASASSM